MTDNRGSRDCAIDMRSQMQSMRCRLAVLERAPRFQPVPDPLEGIRSLALESLCEQDFEILHALVVKQASREQPRELSECEAAACVVWQAALETEAQRMGFRSFADITCTSEHKR